MTREIGRFIILSLALHLLLLSAWRPPAPAGRQALPTLHLTLPRVETARRALSPPPLLSKPASTQHLPVPSSAQPRPTRPLHPRKKVFPPHNATIAPPALSSHTEAIPTPSPAPIAKSGPPPQAARQATAAPIVSRVPRHSGPSVAERLRDVLASRLAYPSLARRRGWEGEASVGLRLETDGRLSHIHLVASSGHAILDRAALRGLERISPLPEVAYWLDGDALEMTLPIEYRLEDN